MTAEVRLADGRAGRARWMRAFELARFGAVGASSTILYLAVYTGAVLTGAPFVVGALAGFLLSAAYGYVVHDHWTFRTRAPTPGGLARWLVLQGTVLGLDIVALWALVVQAGLDRIVAQVTLLPLLPLTSYLLSRRCVFGAS